MSVIDFLKKDGLFEIRLIKNFKVFFADENDMQTKSNLASLSGYGLIKCRSLEIAINSIQALH